MQIRNLVITGANDGIGFQTMKELYLTGRFNIIFGSRNMDKNYQAKNKILKQFQQKNQGKKPPILDYLKLDLGQKQSIEQFVEGIKKNFGKIQFLINNAGALFNKKQVVQQLSFEIQKTLLVDYFGVFYLIFQMFQKNVIDKDGKQEVRIITVSSSAHAYCQNGMFEDLNCKDKFYSTYRQYSIAKFFITTFIKQLARRLQSYYLDRKEQVKVKAVTLHPGLIATSIGSDVIMAKVIKLVSKFWIRSNKDGARSSIYLSLINFDELTNGGYHDQEGRLKEADKRTKDPEYGRQIWQLSESAFKVKFNI